MIMFTQRNYELSEICFFGNLMENGSEGFITKTLVKFVKIGVW